MEQQVFRSVALKESQAPL